MNIVDSIAYAKSEIERNTERLALLEIIAVTFDGIEFPKDMSLSVQRFSSGEIFVDFYPGYQNESPKDLSFIARAITKKFHVRFTKGKGYGEQSIDYKAKFTVGDQKYLVEVTGVIPKSCHIETEQVFMTDEEFEAAKQAAIEAVKPYREVRKIVCK